MIFYTGAQILCTVLLLKPGTWTRNLARILRKLDLEKFSLVGMKHIDLTPKDVRALLSSEAKQVCWNRRPKGINLRAIHLTGHCEKTQGAGLDEPLA